MEDFIEIGITDNDDGTVLLHSMDKRFLEEYPRGRTIKKSLLHYVMLDLASWVNNYADAACFFYMD